MKTIDEDYSYLSPANRRAAKHVRRVYNQARVCGKTPAEAIYEKQLAASAFADFFGEKDEGFDAPLFFRCCGLTEAFIKCMAKARARFKAEEGG